MKVYVDGDIQWIILYAGSCFHTWELLFGIHGSDYFQGELDDVMTMQAVKIKI